MGRVVANKIVKTITRTRLRDSQGGKVRIERTKRGFGKKCGAKNFQDTFIREESQRRQDEESDNDARTMERERERVSSGGESFDIPHKIVSPYIITLLY